MISADLVGYATTRNKGTRDNRKNIRRDRLEEGALNALRHRRHLLHPEMANFYRTQAGELYGAMH